MIRQRVRQFGHLRHAVTLQITTDALHGFLKELLHVHAAPQNAAMREMLHQQPVGGVIILPGLHAVRSEMENDAGGLVRRGDVRL